MNAPNSSRSQGWIDDSIKQWWFYGLLMLTLWTNYLFEPEATNWLRYYRPGILENNEYWRLFTAHLVHLSFNHLVLNSLGFALVIFCCGKELASSFGAVFFVFSAFFVSIGLVFIEPQLIGYVGLSGVLHGLLILAAWFSPYYTKIIKAAFIMVVTGKVLWELTPFYSDADIAEVISGRVVTDAHLLGAISAYLFLAGYYSIRYVLPANQETPET